MTPEEQGLLRQAHIDGFRDCTEVFVALGFEAINAGGIRRDTLQVSARWIVDAGVEFVYIIPDGYTDVPKNKRTGCYDVASVVAYKNAFYAQDWSTLSGRAP